MRKFILIAAMVLASASAQADPSRSLTLAANDEPAAAAQPKASDKAVEQLPAEAPKFVERPSAVEQAPEPRRMERDRPYADRDRPYTDRDRPYADRDRPYAERDRRSARDDSWRDERPRRKRVSTEARVIYELHRLGIYW